MQLPAGRKLGDFTAGVIAKTPPTCGQPESDVAARRFTHHCSGGWYLINVTVVHRGRGCVFISASTAGNDRGDRIVFSRVLRSWRFAR